MTKFYRLIPTDIKTFNGRIQMYVYCQIFYRWFCYLFIRVMVLEINIYSLEKCLSTYIIVLRYLLKYVPT